MNRRKIISEILENMPKEIKEGKDIKTRKIKVRYLYLELCKKCHYDIEYNLADPDTKNEMFNSEFNEENNTGICNEFSEIGVELFKKAGISAIAMDVDREFYDSDKKMEKPLHIYFVFSLDERDETGDQKLYLADPSFDLKRVQIGLSTKYFASNPNTIKNLKGYPNWLSKMSEIELKKIDEVLGYNYNDLKFQEIKNEIQNINIEGISDFAKIVIKTEKCLDELKNRIFRNNIENISISDRQSAYKMLFHDIFSVEMNKNIIDFEIVKNEDGEYVSTLTIKQGENLKKYIFSEKDKNYILDSKLINDDNKSR